MNWIKAHRKGLLAAITAVLLLVVDEETAKLVAGVVGTILTILVPNDQDAVAAIYGK